MKYFSLTIFALLILAGCGKNPYKGKTLPEAKMGFKTDLLVKENTGDELEVPPKDLFSVVEYEAPVGNLPAYLGVPAKKDKKYPAIIWLFGGFSNSIGSTAWEPGFPDNDQSASVFRQEGIVMMYPSLRGGHNNPGHLEGLFGEVDDVLAARDYLANQPFIDPDRIYLGGHSTGGTLALLVSESTDKFRAVFALGPVGNVRGYGSDYFNFDTSNKKEWELRSPVYFLDTISSPTHVFEGTEGNIESLRNLKWNTKNKKIRFYELGGHDHFNIISKVNKMLAKKILLDKEPNKNIFDAKLKKIY